MNNIHKKITFLLVAVLLLSGCDNRHITNLSAAKQHVQNYYEKGEFEQEIKKVVDTAIRYFSSRICCNETSAVVFDIDDTLLWSYYEMKSLQFGYVPKLFHEWILQADAPAVPHVKRLYDFFVDRGCTIILLTGRRQDEREATIKNLHNVGFNHIDLLIMRTEDERNLSALTFKSKHRKSLANEGYDIIATIGDQESDLRGGYAAYRVKIPNYTYLIN